MTLGNREFDDGDDLLADFLRKLKFPIIFSNAHAKHRKLASALVPYKVYNHSIKLGITVFIRSLSPLKLGVSDAVCHFRVTSNHPES